MPTYSIEIWDHPMSAMGVFKGEFTPDLPYESHIFTPWSLWNGLSNDPRLGAGVCLDHWVLVRSGKTLVKGRPYSLNPEPDIHERDLVLFFVRKVD